ncbi:hypothetical protein NDU88_004461 [Pleurodeles waltl]|uniref:Uncharacterized protein n=1 Tax=Pleurodeles waltl TaxID=8319 RepID=A0AAV7VKE5_PLEWA|nr:hypothetical protein NDU88_004461 [Pleurodeles waltl]
MAGQLATVYDGILDTQPQSTTDSPSTVPRNPVRGRQPGQGAAKSPWALQECRRGKWMVHHEAARGDGVRGRPNVRKQNLAGPRLLQRGCARPAGS